MPICSTSTACAQGLLFNTRLTQRAWMRLINQHSQTCSAPSQLGESRQYGLTNGCGQEVLLRQHGLVHGREHDQHRHSPDVDCSSGGWPGNLLWADFLLSGLLVTLSTMPLFHLYAKYPSDDCLHRAAQAGFGKRWGGCMSFINGQLVSIELLFAVTMQVSFFGRCAAGLLPEEFGGWASAVAKLVALALLLVLWCAFRARGALFTASIEFFLGVVELCTVGVLVLSSAFGWAVGFTLRPTMHLLDASETNYSKFFSGVHVAIFAY